MADKTEKQKWPREIWEIYKFNPIELDENGDPISPLLSEPVTDNFEIAVEIAASTVRVQRL